MKLLKFSLLSIVSLSIFAYSDATGEWTIEQTKLPKSCTSPSMKELDDIKRDIAVFIKNQGLPTREGHKFSKVDIKGLRFDNQGAARSYPEHTLYQVQFGTGIGKKNKDNGGCYAAAAIQHGAPQDKILETIHQALEDPKHLYRLSSTTEKKDRSHKKTDQSNTNSEPRGGLSKSEKQALAKMLSKKSEKRELVKTQQQFMEESIESSMDTESSIIEMESKHPKKEDTFRILNTQIDPQHTIQKQPHLKGQAQIRAQEKAKKILNEIMPNVPKREYYTKFYETLETYINRNGSDPRLQECLRRLGHKLLEHALANPVEPGRPQGALYGWKSSVLFWVEASEDAQKHVRKVFE